QVVLDKLGATVSAQRYDGTSPATLSADGHGAIYMMGWGAGSPSLDSQFGWETSQAYGMAILLWLNYSALPALPSTFTIL
ncbi:DUF5121 domain-containing protein, partial [Acinetobacter baumannii]|uniref:DUF5121 domain-containing protein n=1 Tax=Acinetobacter baumannii TaxID=470 RepID=UPI0011C4B6A5